MNAPLTARGPCGQQITAGLAPTILNPKAAGHSLSGLYDPPAGAGTESLGPIRTLQSLVFRRNHKLSVMKVLHFDR